MSRQTHKAAQGAASLTHLLISNILIDNSTYFSAMQALEVEQMDGSMLYNLGTLLECVVLSDRVSTSPTLAWAPSQQDILFHGSGPLANIEMQNWSDNDAAALFVAAIDESLQDVRTKSVWKGLGFNRADVDIAASALTQWRKHAERSPQEFFSIYSQAVYVTDPASGDKVARLGTGLNRDAPSGYHLAQFLLRTNVAFELSSEHAYNPHSHRLLYIDRRIARAHRQALQLGQAVVRAAEDEFNDATSLHRAEAILGRLTPYGDRQSLPFVMGATLSLANNSEEVLSAALDIRNRRSARRYRAWVNRLAIAPSEPDIDARLEAERELLDARDSLFRELRALAFGRLSRDRGRTNSAATVSGVIDAKTVAGLASGDLIGTSTETVSRLISATPALLERLLDWRRGRRTVLVLELAREASTILDLNERIQQVFGRGLEDSELARFDKLQSEHRKRAAAISRIIRGRIPS